MNDYLGEMLTVRPIDDATAEALLTGGAVTADLEPLAAALAAYRCMADRPVSPSPELAAQMAAGVFIGPTDLTERYEPALVAVTSHRDRASDRRRIRGAARVMAKLAGMGLAAKTFAGLGVATAAAGTAGFAGALPDPAQQRFETVVESVTRYEFPDRADENSQFGEQVSDDATRDDATRDDATRDDATRGGADGEDVSEDARRQGEQHRPDHVPAPVPTDAGKPAEPGEPGLPNPAEPDRPGNPPIDPPGEQRRRPPAPPGR